MLHEYRKKTTIKAEQFDGSKKMAKRYGLEGFGPGEFVQDLTTMTCPSIFEEPETIKKGDWLVMCGTSEISEVLSDEDFRLTYERCE